MSNHVTFRPFDTRWPELPSGPELSARDVGLIDLARYAGMRAAAPLHTIEADTKELWRLLIDKADDLGPGLNHDDIFETLKPVALTWARERAEQRRLELCGA